MFDSAIQSSTKIDFPSGTTVSSSKVIFVDQLTQDTDNSVIITKNTPFHPVNYKWADQPGDLGFVSFKNHNFKIINTLTGAINLSDLEFYLDAQIPVRRGEDGWAFVVAHIVNFSDNYSPKNLLNKTVILEVDAERRKKISAAHSSSHLMALALNKYTSNFWKKEARTDSLNNPDLDQLAIQKSEITEMESHDFYRLGKSLKKKGFDTAAFFEHISEVETCINEQVSEWIKLEAQVNIEPREAKLDDHRVWICQLPDGLAKIPCGGTHIDNLKRISSIHVTLERMSYSPESLLIHTTVDSIVSV